MIQPRLSLMVLLLDILILSLSKSLHLLIYWYKILNLYLHKIFRFKLNSKVWLYLFLIHLEALLTVHLTPWVLNLVLQYSLKIHHMLRISIKLLLRTLLSWIVMHRNLEVQLWSKMFLLLQKIQFFCKTRQTQATEGQYSFLGRHSTIKVRYLIHFYRGLFWNKRKHILK